MRAVGYRNPLPITDPEALIDIDLPDPTPSRREFACAGRGRVGEPGRCQGAGEGCAVSGRCALLASTLRAWFRLSDQTPRSSSQETRFTIGSIARQGPTRVHVVDERIVGRKPASLTFPQAAAMPLTTITAWELLFHRLGIFARGQIGERNAACHRRRRRRRLYFDSACTPIDGADGHRHCIAPREPGLDIGYGRHLVIDDQRPLNEGAGRCRICECRSGRKPDRDRHHCPPLPRPSLLRAVSRSSMIPSSSISFPSNERGLDPLGVHVHETLVRNQRHDRAA